MNYITRIKLEDKRECNYFVECRAALENWMNQFSESDWKHMQYLIWNKQ